MMVNSFYLKNNNLRFLEFHVSNQFNIYSTNTYCRPTTIMYYTKHSDFYSKQHKLTSLPSCSLHRFHSTALKIKLQNIQFTSK